MNKDSPLLLMKHFIGEVEAIDYVPILLTAEEKYGLREFKISHINPAQVYQIYSSVCTKFKRNSLEKSQLNWWQNELRIFIWVLISYLELRKLSIDLLVHIEQVRARQIGSFSHGCSQKRRKFCSSTKGTATNKWTIQEDEQFSKLIPEGYQKSKWSEYAKQLYILSDKRYFRTAKQCRQRWLNHLDPTKSKDDWQPRQDYVLIAHVHNKGKKWAQIAKMLKNRRNEHSIKNRFKSLVTKQEKLHADRLDEEVLVGHIYSKYQAQFAQCQASKNMLGQTAVKPQILIPPFLPPDKRPVFQIISSTVIKPHPKQTNKDAIYIEESDRHPSQYRQQIIPPIRTSGLHDSELIDRSQFQKQIRADMFLSLDPFQFLKRFFHSKDSVLQE